MPQRAAAPVRRHPRAAGRQLRGRSRAHGRALGGPGAGPPTCQVIPAAFPGYEPYCPYTETGRAPGGGGPRRTWSAPASSWRRPASRRARRVWGRASGRGSQSGAISSALLGRLGFRASLHVSVQRRTRPPRRARAIAGGLLRLGGRLRQRLERHRGPFTCAAIGPERRTSRSSAIAGSTARSTARWPRQVRMPPRRGPPPTAASWNRRGVGPDDEPPLRRVRLQTSRERPDHLQWFTLLDQLWVR